MGRLIPEPPGADQECVSTPPLRMARYRRLGTAPGDRLATGRATRRAEHCAQASAHHSRHNRTPGYRFQCLRRAAVRGNREPSVGALALGPAVLQIPGVCRHGPHFDVSAGLGRSPKRRPPQTAPDTRKNRHCRSNTALSQALHCCRMRASGPRMGAPFGLSFGHGNRPCRVGRLPPRHARHTARRPTTLPQPSIIQRGT